MGPSRALRHSGPLLSLPECGVEGPRAAPLNLRLTRSSICMLPSGPFGIMTDMCSLWLEGLDLANISAAEVTAGQPLFRLHSKFPSITFFMKAIRVSHDEGDAIVSHYLGCSVPVP